MILAWDPGDVRVGFAMAEHWPEKRKLDLKICQTVPAEEVYSMLGLAETLLEPGQKHTFVVENFRIDTKGRGVTFQWNEMLTIRMIGALEYAAFRMNDSPVVMQEPGHVLGNAKRWAPFPWKKSYDKHLPDHLSAYCHLANYAIKKGLIDTTDDILENGQEKLW